MIAFLQKFHTIALNLLFPKRCVGCGQVDTYLCPICLRQIEKNDNFHGEDQVFLFHYNDRRIKRLIWLLKYRNIKEIADLFGKLLYEMVIEELAEELLFSPASGKVIIIPAPLSPKRLKMRGYNQAEEIAKTFTNNDHKSFALRTDLLKKIKETPSQVSIHDRRARLKNLAGAFALLGGKKLKGRTVILLDDVSTTGATLAECEKIVRKAGARKIFKLAVAHG